MSSRSWPRCSSASSEFYIWGEGLLCTRIGSNDNKYPASITHPCNRLMKTDVSARFTHHWEDFWEENVLTKGGHGPFTNMCYWKPLAQGMLCVTHSGPLHHLSCRFHCSPADRPSPTASTNFSFSSPWQLVEVWSPCVCVQASSSFLHLQGRCKIHTPFNSKVLAAIYKN